MSSMNTNHGSDHLKGTGAAGNGHAATATRNEGPSRRQASAPEGAGVGTGLERAVKGARDTLVDVPGKARQILDHSSEWARESLTTAQDWARRTVQERPAATTGTVFGIGMCLGVVVGCVIGAFAFRSKLAKLSLF